MTVKFDSESPLDRVPGEPRTSNRALRDYYEMGSTRSLRGLAAAYRQGLKENPNSCPPSIRHATIFTWSTKFSWQERIERMTDLDLIAANEAKKKAVEENARLWADRQNNVRERDWSQGEQIRQLVDNILQKAPEYVSRKQKTVKGKNGEPDRIIITEKLNAKVLLDGLLVASKLQRLAAEMETDHLLSENTTPEDMETIKKKRWQAVFDQLPELDIDSADPIDSNDGGIEKAHEEEE